MIAACVTKDFGVMASDSAVYLNGKTGFDFPKMLFTGKYLMTFIGHMDYFSRIEKEKLNLSIPALSLYLQDYFKSMTPDVGSSLRELNENPDDHLPRLCVFIMGTHGGKPVVAQINSFLDFKPKYLYSDGGPRFSTIFYGDDSAEKKRVFLSTTSFMERKAGEWKEAGVELTPGVIGEILTRGIHKKSDAEMRTPPFKKYAGGAVSVAKIMSDGKAYPMTHTIF